MSEIERIERMMSDKKVRKVPLTPAEQKRANAQKALDILGLDKEAKFVFFKKLDKISDQLEDLLHTEVPVNVEVEIPNMPDFPEIPVTDLSETNNLLKSLILSQAEQSKKIDALVVEMQKPIEIELNED